MRELLSYDPASGSLRWRVDRENGAKAGEQCGHHGPRYQVRIDGQKQAVARLAFVLMTGRWPRGVILVRDLDQGNHAWANFEHVSASERGHRRPVMSRSRTGVKGVTMEPNGSFRAAARIRGRLKYLGLHPTVSAAAAAYARAVSAR